MQPVSIKPSLKPSIKPLSSSKAKPYYRIGVMSDTHGRLHPDLPRLFENVNEIWHLGDVCEEEVLDHIKRINGKLTVVLGNNDYLKNDYPITNDLERHGEHFHLIHIRPKVVEDFTGWLLYGHTHRPVNEFMGKLHLFNPGSAGLANKGAPLSIGYISWVEGHPARARIELLRALT